jgi:hypothetical protein
LTTNKKAPTNVRRAGVSPDGRQSVYHLHPFRSRNQTASCFDKQNDSLGVEAAAWKYPFPVVFDFLLLNYTVWFATMKS